LLKLLSFFDSGKWKKSKKEYLFRRKESSVYFLVTEEQESIFIDVWGEGSFGAISSPARGGNPALLQKCYDNITSELFVFFKLNDVDYRKGTTHVIAKPFVYRYLLMLMLSLLVAFLVILYDYIRLH